MQDNAHPWMIFGDDVLEIHGDKTYVRMTRVTIEVSRLGKNVFWMTGLPYTNCK